MIRLVKIVLTAKQRISKPHNAWVGGRIGDVEKGATEVVINGLPVFVTANDTTGRRKKAYVTFSFWLEGDDGTHGIALEMRLDDVSSMCHEIFVPEPVRGLGQVVPK